MVVINSLSSFIVPGKCMGMGYVTDKTSQCPVCQWFFENKII